MSVPPGPNLEARARAARRGALPADAMTGHTADDQAETVLLRLLRGAGGTGLAAMEPGHRHPILALRRRETEAVCRALDVTPIRDASNELPDAWRNRVRAELLPLADDIAGRDVVPIIARTADLLRADDEFLDELATAIDPTNDQAFYNLALVHIELRSFERAKQDLQQAITINGEVAGYQEKLGTVLMQLEEWAEAKTAFEASIELDPDLFKAYFKLAQVLEELEDPQNALQRYTEAIQHGPRFLEAYSALGRLYADLGYLDQAAQVLNSGLEVAMEGTEEEANLHHLLGTVYQQQRNFDQAITHFRAALDIVPGMRDALFSLGDYYRGSLYGYQTDGDAYLMFYNRDWLEDPEAQKRFADRHGYALMVPETWEQLDAMMAFFHQPEAERYGGALFRTPTYIAWEFWIRFHAKGHWPFDAEMVPQIAGEAGVEALEELIAASKHLYPAARSNGLFDNWKAFARGNIFCNVGWGGTQKHMNGADSAVRGRLAFGPTPGGLVEGRLLVVPYFNWGWNYAVSSRSKQPEIAYLFALYACSPAMSTLAVREPGGFFDPFRKEHYGDRRIVETYGPDFLVAHRESMVRSIPDLYLKGQGEYFDALRENLVLADSGAISAREALERTAKQWRRTTRRMGQETQEEQWAFLRSRYPAEVQQALR